MMLLCAADAFGDVLQRAGHQISPLPSTFGRVFRWVRLKELSGTN